MSKIVKIMDIGLWDKDDWADEKDQFVGGEAEWLEHKKKLLAQGKIMVDIEKEK